MKTILFYIGLCCFFMACTNDDINVMESDFYGDWGLISTKTDREIDYDFDGDVATNIIDDLNCFTIELNLNSDSTFSEAIIDRFITNDGVECLIIASKGNWKYLRDVNQIQFNYLDINDNIVNTINSSFIINKNNSLEFSREFTDNQGTFNADLQFSFINN